MRPPLGRRRSWSLVVVARWRQVSEESVLRALLRQPSIARARLMDEFAQKDVFEAVETVEDESRRDRNNPKLKANNNNARQNGARPTALLSTLIAATN